MCHVEQHVCHVADISPHKLFTTRLSLCRHAALVDIERLTTPGSVSRGCRLPVTRVSQPWRSPSSHQGQSAVEVAFQSPGSVSRGGRLPVTRVSQPWRSPSSHQGQSVVKEVTVGAHLTAESDTKLYLDAGDRMCSTRYPNYRVRFHRVVHAEFASH